MTQPTERDRREFRRIFKAELKPYWISPLLGFDITKFDDEIVKSGGQQMKAAVMQTWGIDGVNLIYRLLEDSHV